MEERKGFSFGKNWQRFLNSLNEDRFKSAELSLTDFLRLADLQDKTLLDVGCGSGLFSYAAFRLGAKKIISFDLDPFSVECCRYLHEQANSPHNWEIHEGSILDDTFCSQLGRFDIVYAWGVLHHTGDMWRAIKNAAELVNDGGYYYIAIYNRTDNMLGSRFWLQIKKIYNSSPRIVRSGLEAMYMLTYLAVNLMKLRNPIPRIWQHESERGMNWKTDVADWLGGYPYEFATVEEVFRFMRDNFSAFHLVNLKTTNGLANNWYLFRKNGE